MKINRIVSLAVSTSFWLICNAESFCGGGFVEKGVIYSLLSPTVADSSSVVLNGYETPSSFELPVLEISACVVHEGRNYNVKEIGRYALTGLTNVESIVIGQGIERIHDGAFCYCPNLRSISIPSSVKNISSTVCYGCPNLTTLTVEPESGLYDSRNSSNAIIDTANDILMIGCAGTKIPVSVEDIAEFAFSGCYTLDSICIPEGIEHIASSAFSNCSSMKKISLPSSLETIGMNAFANCSSLESVYIPKGISDIGEGNIFAGCINLSSIEVDKENEEYDSRSGCNGIVKKKDSTLIASSMATTITPDIRQLGDFCFSGLNIHSFSLPKTVIEFTGRCFRDCNEIDSLSVSSEHQLYWSPEGSNAILTKDGKQLIVGCRATNIPEGIEVIGDEAFYGRYTRPLLKLPMGLEVIGENAFLGCNKIRSILLPSSLHTIGNSCFNGCSGIISLYISEGVTNIGEGTFCGCTGLVNVHLPSSLKDLGAYAFQGCQNLTEIVFPEGIKEIHHSTFDGCVNLKIVRLPSTLERIEPAAFRNCRSLEEVKIPDGVREILADAFAGCPCEGEVKQFIGKK